MPACYRLWISGIALALAVPAICRADDVKTVTDPATGVTYQETRQVIQTPVVETRMVTQQQTVMTDQCKTQMQSVVQTYQVPVTEYVWEAYWANRWNPFEEPYIAYRMVPRVRWELHTQTVQMPVTTHQWVPQTQTVQVPQTTQRFVAEEWIHRVPVSGGSTDPFAQGTSSVASRPSLSPTPGSDGTTLH